MMLRSLALGLYGKADVVELAVEGEIIRSETIVEFKRGSPKHTFDREFRIQLCAQAICLEEAIPGVPITAAIHYRKVPSASPSNSIPRCATRRFAVRVTCTN